MSNTKIYLGNLSKQTTDTQLKEHFSRFGEITQIQLPIDDKSKELKGYAFITFNEENAANNALIQDGTLFLDNEISVQIATEKRVTKKKVSKKKKTK